MRDNREIRMGIAMALVWGLLLPGSTMAAVGAEADSSGGSPKILGSEWREISAADPPAVRKEHAMVYDPSADRILMAGEYYGTGDSLRTVTWAYEPGAELWKEVSPADPPQARIGPSMASCAEDGQTVMFGGKGFDGITLADTWIYAPLTNTWTNVTNAVSPSARSGHTLVYADQTRTFVLFGGRDSLGRVLGDTWHLDLSSRSWTNITTDDSPTPRSDYGAAYDSGRGLVVLFGGRDANIEPMGDLWMYDPGTRVWKAGGGSAGPEPRWGASLVYHPTSERVVLFGGIGRMWEEMGFNDTWALDTKGQSWEELGSDAGPSNRFHQAMTYDPARDRLVLFGGSTGGYSLILGDTWTLELETEAKKVEKGPMPARFDLGSSVALLILLLVAAGMVCVLWPRRNTSRSQPGHVSDASSFVGGPDGRPGTKGGV